MKLEEEEELALPGKEKSRIDHLFASLTWGPSNLESFCPQLFQLLRRVKYCRTSWVVVLLAGTLKDMPRDKVR